MAKGGRELTGSERGDAAEAGLTARVRDYALAHLDCDLVGVANIERFEHAPLMMSPQGIMPHARSVIVMGLHHPDACVELGGLAHPQEVGPYRVQYDMNSVLDEISYGMALFMEDEGFEAVPIVSSNIWRYKGYKDLKEHFAPDLSHRHAAVAAGLAEFGYSGLAITPEYGARQRWVTVVTDAVLAPTPLLDPGSVCDDCRLCAEHCLAEALTKELDGWSVVRIEDTEYRYINKNLWRCSWGEHFNLDLDLELPDHVDEKVILDAVAKYGERGGEMGSCLRFCVPKALRFFEPEYTDAPRRRRRASAPAAPPRILLEELVSIGTRRGADFTLANDAAALADLGIDIRRYLPDGVTAVTVGLHHNGPSGRPPDTAAGFEKRFRWVRRYVLARAAYDIARALERRGYSAVTMTDFPEEDFERHIDGIQPGRVVRTLTVITSAALPVSGNRLAQTPQPPGPRAPELTAALRQVVTEAGADLVGVAPAGRFAQIAGALAGIFDGERFLVARDKGPRSFEYDPEVTWAQRRARAPSDYLEGARSVLVIGIRIPRATMDCTVRTPAEAVGPYAFAQYESAHLLETYAWRAMRFLEDRGFRAVWTLDLCGTGSVVGNPRGEQPDVFSNRFAALAAGLGRIAKCGFLITPEHGANARFIALVTDAELAGDSVMADESLLGECEGCERGRAACLTGAFGAEVAVTVEGVEERFLETDRNRCDWAKRYSLVGAEGNDYMGWGLTVPVPEKITPEALADGLRRHPPISKYRPCNFERCLMACPYARAQD